MASNIVFITAIDPEDKAIYKESSFKAWKHWCDKNNAQLYIHNDPKADNREIDPHWLRYTAFDILTSRSIDFKQVALVDMDTTIHPDCENFFSLTKDKLGCVVDIDNPLWNLFSLSYFSPFFPNTFIEWGSYFNTGVIIANKQHQDFFKKNVNFFLKNKKNPIKKDILNEDCGYDQTPFNYLIRTEKIEVANLALKFNITQPHVKSMIAKSIFQEIVGIWHFNSVQHEDRIRVMQEFCEVNSIG